jgi:hypothetical protein
MKRLGRKVVKKKWLCYPTIPLSQGMRGAQGNKYLSPRVQEKPEMQGGGKEVRICGCMEKIKRNAEAI